MDTCDNVYICGVLSLKICSNKTIKCLNFSRLSRFISSVTVGRLDKPEHFNSASF